MFAAPTNAESLAVGIVFPILCGIAVVLRFFLRQRRNVAVLPDDWFTIPAWIFTTGMCVSIIYAIVRNVFQQKNLPVGETVNDAQREFAALSGAISILWLAAASCIKFSIIFLYRRLFFVGRILKTCIYVLLVLNTLWTLYGFLAWLLFCGKYVEANFEGSWDVCQTWGLHIQIGVYVLDTALDFALLLFPIRPVLSLQIQPQKRVDLLLTFLIGSFAFVASLLNTTLQILDITSSGTFGTALPDEIFFYWQAIEVGVGLLFCNMPVLHPLWNLLLGKQTWSDIAPSSAYGSASKHATMRTGHASGVHELSRVGTRSPDLGSDGRFNYRGFVFDQVVLEEDAITSASTSKKNRPSLVSVDEVGSSEVLESQYMFKEGERPQEPDRDALLSPAARAARRG